MSERELTGDGAQVEVVPDDLLQFVVHRSFLEAQAEVVTQVFVYHASWSDRNVRKEGVFSVNVTLTDVS